MLAQLTAAFLVNLIWSVAPISKFHSCCMSPQKLKIVSQSVRGTFPGLNYGSLFAHKPCLVVSFTFRAFGHEGANGTRSMSRLIFDSSSNFALPEFFSRS
jgi:hypothetical protein